MLNFEQVILSKDVRDCMAKNGMELSDMDKAAIVYNSWRSIGLNSLDEMFSELREIAETTKDEALKIQIEERLEFEDEQRRLFRENTEGFMYALKVQSTDGICHDTEGYFADEDSAIEYAKTFGRRFSVEKYQIVNFNGAKAIPGKIYYNRYFCDKSRDRPCVKDAEYSGFPIAEKKFNERGELRYFRSDENGAVSDEKICEFLFDPSGFEHKFPNIPDPFERGDIVRFRFFGREYIGVVGDSREEREKFRVLAINKERYAEYGDAVIKVFFPYRAIGLNDVCASLINTESCELGSDDTTEKCLLEETSKILKGGGDLSDFMLYHRGYIKENEEKNKFRGGTDNA